MSTDNRDLVLLGDALDRTIASPGSPHCWHNLAPLYRAADDNIRQRAMQLLLQHTPADGVAGFLRATFLSSLQSDAGFFEQAGAVLNAISPFDGERIYAFLVYGWNHTLRTAGDRSAFTTALRRASIPELVYKLGRDFAERKSSPLPERPITAIQKVAIVTSQMSLATHAPSGLALDQASILMRHGIETAIFSGQELTVGNMHQFLGNGETTHLAAPTTESWSARVDGPLQAHLADTRLSVLGRLSGLAQSINRFDPDLILFVGFYSAIMPALHAARPTVGLSIHSTPPLAPVDVWLTADKDQADAASAMWSPYFPDSITWHHPYRIRHTPAISPRTRQELGLPENAVVMVTAGYRLESEINGAWAQRMLDFLDIHSEAVWLLVGGDGKVPSALRDASASRLRTLPHQSNLSAVLKCCDIYVNPPRMGGGFSVAEAMAEGLPVLAFSGSDGGNKIGQAAQPGGRTYFSALAQLVQDAEMREKSGAEMRRLFAETLDINQSGPGLLAACEAALERFRVRTRQATS